MAAQAVTFNGSSQYGKITNFSGLDSLGNFTLEFWVKRAASGGSYDSYAELGNGATDFLGMTQEASSPSDGFNWHTRHATTDADGYIADGSGFLASATWTHIGIIFRTTENKTSVFKNGVEWNGYNLQQTAVGAIQSSTGMDLYFAVDSALAGYCACDIGGFVRFWNRAITGAEMYYNYDKILTPASESGLIVNCGFTEGSGTVVDNDATAGADINLTGSPSWTTFSPTLTAKSYSNSYIFGQVAQQSDDVEEVSTGGTPDIASSDYEVVVDGATTQQLGFRFQNVTIPNGYTIQAAYLRLVGDESQSAGTENVDIYGEAADNSSTFSTAANNLTGRTKTTAKVDWDALAGSVPGTLVTSPDIKTVVQEIVNRAGWSSGNAMSVILAPGGSNATRTYESYDGQFYSSAMLHIEYTAPAAGGTTHFLTLLGVGS